MAAATMHRSTWGLDSHRGTPWWERAACIDTAEMHTGDHRQVDIAARARHICLAHCPVLRQCAAEAERYQPRGVVQGGRIWPELGYAGRRVVPIPEPGCGQWCAHLRRPS